MDSARSSAAGQQENRGCYRRGRRRKRRMGTIVSAAEGDTGPQLALGSQAAAKIVPDTG